MDFGSKAVMEECGECDHPAFAHRWNEPHGCLVLDCRCRGFTQVQKRRSKYAAVAVIVCAQCLYPKDFCACKPFIAGRRFASQGEARRARELDLRQRAGDIDDLQYQVRFPLHVSGKAIGTYVADFVYVDRAGKKVIEDFKGFPTPLFRWKAKHFEAEYGQRIEVIS